MQQRWRTWCGLWLLTLSLAACDARAPAASDPHDPATMDFKSPPARITIARHTRGFAAGNALSMRAALKPLDQAPVKEVRLDATHKIIEIAPGVKFAGWTFGDQVPGPTIRARVGDKIRFTMTNRSDESVPGVRVTTAPMMHWRYSKNHGSWGTSPSRTSPTSWRSGVFLTEIVPSTAPASAPAVRTGAPPDGAAVELRFAPQNSRTFVRASRVR